MKSYKKPISELVKFHTESCIMAGSQGSTTPGVKPSTDPNAELGARRKVFGGNFDWTE